MIKRFRLDTATANYEKILNPSQTANLIRSNEIQTAEKTFWKSKAESLATIEQMEMFYEERDKEKIELNEKN